MMPDISEIRADFPILSTDMHGHKLIYLDNAATMQIPIPVQERIISHYRNDNANVHRGVHALSRASTEAMENARCTAANFIESAPEEVIFTSGATDSLNLLARMLENRINAGDHILVSAMEHHSNLIPWQELCRRTGAVLDIVPLDARGNLDLDALRTQLKTKTTLLAVTWVSNVTGAVNPVAEISAMAHDAGALVVVDGAQGMKMGKTDVAALGCDFFAFSGHKIGALTGIGVLYGRHELLETLSPVTFGGGMVRNTEYCSASWGDVPQRFEAGTPNYVGAISLGAAMEYLVDHDIEEIGRREASLTELAVKSLTEIPGVHLLGNPRRRCGSVSFTVDGVNPLDLGFMLDSLGIAVRTGHLCAQPLVDHFNVNSVVRVSPAFYNTEGEIRAFTDAMLRVLPMLKGAKE